MSAHVNIFNKKREKKERIQSIKPMSVYINIKIKKVKREKKDWLKW